MLSDQGRVSEGYEEDEIKERRRPKYDGEQRLRRRRLRRLPIGELASSLEDVLRRMHRDKKGTHGADYRSRL